MHSVKLDDLLRLGATGVVHSCPNLSHCFFMSERSSVNSEQISIFQMNVHCVGLRVFVF